MTLTDCPVCGGKDLNEVVTAIDHLVSNKSFTLVECTICRTRITNPRPDENELSQYYQSEEYISHTNEGNSLINRIYKVARYFTLRNKRKLISIAPHNQTLLDVGCGTGNFIHHCRDNGWKVVGVEPDPSARNIAKEDTKNIVHKDLHDLHDQEFDRVTLWHVLEHLPNLSDTFIRLKNLLSANGKIFIAVPNYLAWEESKFKEYWAAYDVPRHLHHFTPNSIHVLAQNNGLEVERTYPMRLDSFYISLLSNKNKTGYNRLVNSFLTGLLSNIYARKSGNYSSLIYQLKKKSG